MDTVTELQHELSHAVKSAADITDKVEAEERAMTKDEREDFDKFEERVATIQEGIDDHIETAKRTEKVKALQEALKQPDLRQSPVITQTPDKPDPDDPVPYVRYGRTIAFPETADGHRRAYRAGMWCRAVLCGDEKARRWCITRGVETRALSESINTAGGTLVPEEMLTAIIDLRESFGRFRENAQVMPMARDSMTIPRTVDDMTATFTGENKQAGETDLTFNNVELTAKKLTTLTRISTELAEDAIIGIADLVARKMAYAFAVKEDDVGFTGDGTASDGGIVGIQTIFENDNSLAGAIDGKATVDLFSEVDAETITNVIAQLPDYAEANAQFFCSRVGAELMFSRLMAAGGGNTMTDLAGRPQRTYLGYPIVVVNSMRKVTTTLNDLVMFLFGDLALSSTLGESRAISVRVSTERYFEFDQLGIIATERIAVNNHDFGSTTAGDTGPIVACIGAT